jgi:hypothetical protein
MPAKPAQRETAMADRSSVISDVVTISGVTLHVYALSDGSRVIKTDDIAKLFEAWVSGAWRPDEAEAAALAPNSND